MHTDAQVPLTTMYMDQVPLYHLVKVQVPLAPAEEETSCPEGLGRCPRRGLVGSLTLAPDKKRRQTRRKRDPSSALDSQSHVLEQVSAFSRVNSTHGLTSS